jgi:hypothetical protein
MFCHGFRQWDLCGPGPEDEPIDEPVRVDERRDLDIRVSQAERDGVAAELARHYADGRLSVAEYEERVSAALDARTGHDLEALLTDLPTAPVEPRDQRSPDLSWRRLAPHLPRLLAVTAVVVLAIGNGAWLLWLLWPALALTSPRRARVRHHYERRLHPPHRSRPRYHGRPAIHWL